MYWKLRFIGDWIFDSIYADNVLFISRTIIKIIFAPI